ncbi:hypothetical protein K445DRAFT_311159 [Daldinia sp. EC12]|nr:hypothetical protein K445DRAFT_311159 [Daldinia sp. EC12]
MSEAEITDLISRLESFPKPKDKAQCQRLWEAARSFSAKIETEPNLQHRLLSAPLQLVIPRIASDLHIFEILVQSKEPISTTELGLTDSNSYMGRILRYLAAQFLITSPSPRFWASSPLTSFLANLAYAAGLRFGTVCVLPSEATLPALLSNNSYKDTSALNTTAFQLGHGTHDSFFEWLSRHPDDRNDFQQWMAETHKRQQSAFGGVNLSELLRGSSLPEAPVFVDVGGGNGQSCAEFLDMYPESASRVINQDLQATTIGTQSKGIVHQDHDFFAEQPVKGAKIYHFRKVLHNWSADECVELLSRTREAMGRESRIVVDDIAIEESNLDWHLSYVDLTMGILFGTRERTLDEFKYIFERAGLTLGRVVKYGKGSGEHIMVLS